MSADGVANGSVAAPGDPVPASQTRRGAGLGIAAFVLAAFFAIVPDLAIGLVPDLTDHDVNGITGIMSLFSLLPLILGIVAVVTRRGRYWGIAAITLSLLSNFLVFAFVSVMHTNLGEASLTAWT